MKYLLLISILFLQPSMKAFNLETYEEGRTSELAFEALNSMIETLNAALAIAGYHYPLVDDTNSNVTSDNIDAPINMDGETLLIKAIRENQDLNLIKLLLEFGADPEYSGMTNINERDRFLSKAIRENNKNAAEVLLKSYNKSNPNSMIKNLQDEPVKNALYYAQRAKDPRVFALLIEYMTPQAQIIRAVKRGDLRAIESILNNHLIIGNINSIVDANGRTPLIWAVIFDRPNVVSYFLNNGANYTIQDGSGKSFEDYIMGLPDFENIFNAFKARRQATQAALKQAMQQVLPVAIIPNDLQNIVLQYL